MIYSDIIIIYYYDLLYVSTCNKYVSVIVAVPVACLDCWCKKHGGIDRAVHHASWPCAQLNLGFCMHKFCQCHLLKLHRSLSQPSKVWIVLAEEDICWQLIWQVMHHWCHSGVVAWSNLATWPFPAMALSSDLRVAMIWDAVDLQFKMNLGQLTQHNEKDSLEGSLCSVQSGIELGTILTSNCVWQHVKLVDKWWQMSINVNNIW